MRTPEYYFIKRKITLFKLIHHSSLSSTSFYNTTSQMHQLSSTMSCSMSSIHIHSLRSKHIAVQHLSLELGWHLMASSSIHLFQEINHTWRMKRPWAVDRKTNTFISLWTSIRLRSIFVRPRAAHGWTKTNQCLIDS